MSSRLLLALAAVLCALAPVSATSDELDLARAVDAIWRVRSITFRFSSPTTFYYCDVLKQRVTDILRAVGAGEHMDIGARCAVGSLINDTSVRVVVGVPIEATNENVAAETTFDTRTALVARSMDWTLPTPTTVRRFRAIRKDVSFARMNIQLSPSDCDLLQAMSERVFPELGIRVKNRLYCTTGSRPLTNLGLTVEALMPL